MDIGQFSLSVVSQSTFLIAAMGETEQQVAGSAVKAQGRVLRARNWFAKIAVWQVLLALLTVGYFLALLLHPPNVYDEGLTVDGAVRILHGQLPYRDFNTGYAPAEFYTVAAVF